MARYGVERKLHTSTITNIRHVGEHFVVKPGPVRQPVVRGWLRGLAAARRHCSPRRVITAPFRCGSMLHEISATNVPFRLIHKCTADYKCRRHSNYWKDSLSASSFSSWGIVICRWVVKCICHRHHFEIKCHFDVVLFVQYLIVIHRLPPQAFPSLGHASFVPAIRMPRRQFSGNWKPLCSWPVVAGLGWLHVWSVKTSCLA